MLKSIYTFLLIALFHCSVAQKAKLILPVGLTGEVDQLEISTNQKYLYTTSGKLFQVWDYQSGNELDSVILPFYNGYGPKSINPDKKLIIYQELKKNDIGEIVFCNIHLYNFLTKKIIKTFSVGKRECNAIYFSTDAKYIIVAAGVDPFSTDNILLRYTIFSGATETMDSNIQGINSISVSADKGMMLLSPYTGGKAYLYRIDTLYV